MRSTTYLLLACALLPLSIAAQAQSTSFTTPHLTTASGAETVTLNGNSFVNQGLVGVGRLAASTRDFAGETLGSFSGMAIDLKSWRRNANGSYSGSIFTLPDRGPNDVGPFVGTTNYRNRVHISSITLNPYTSTTPLPAATSSQNQLAITPTGGFFLLDATGVNFTGQDAGANVIQRGGISYPSPATGPAAGRISLDSEGIAFAPDGSFYVSDEYAAGIYRFDATGRQTGAIQTIPAILPFTAGALNFNGTAAPTTGRRNNQGLEALAITPDGNRLVTILQSATVQDTNGSNQQTRNNTRILIYDISTNPTPTNPIAHYVLQLPIFNSAGAGAAPNRTAAQSEMLALNGNQFLVLARDGQGRGGGGTPIIYKSILLVDTTGATNLAGTGFETGTTPIATNGTLATGVTPVQQVELVNMLNPVQLNRFGMNLNSAPSDILSITEKWEALGLVPVLEEGKPQDFFLLVGNDNDFQSSTGFINGQPFDASLTTNGSGSNDSLIMVYRLSLPTYVDPQALAAMTTNAPLAINATRSAAADIGLAGTRAGLAALQGARQIGETGMGSGVRLWFDGGYARVNSAELGAGDLRADGYRMSFGADTSFGPARIGVLVSHRKLDGDFGAGTRLKAKGTSLGAYAGVGFTNGLYAQAAFARTVDLAFRDVTRASAYGLSGTGSPDGEAWSAGAEIGYQMAMGKLRVGPFLGVDFVDAEIDGYTETGAALGNVAYNKVGYKRTTGAVGIEAKLMATPAFVPSLRVGYAAENEKGDRSASVRLASAQHSMATRTVGLAETERDFVTAAIGFTGSIGEQIFWQAGGENRFVKGEDELRANIGIGFRF